MRVLLVSPPVPQSYYNSEYYVPSGLMYLATMLRNNGEEVKLLDLKTYRLDESENAHGFYEDMLIDTILTFRPNMIGFGCLFACDFPDVLKLSILCKERFETIPIVAGGLHITIHAASILAECPSIDWIVQGEAEESLVQLVETLKTKSYEFNKIDGLAYRVNGEVVVNPKKRFIQDVDGIPFPAYDLIDMEDYYVDTSDWHNPKGLSFNMSAPIISSRSCPNRCSFCSAYMSMGPKWRARTARNVVDEIEYWYHTYQQTHFSFMDDNLTLDKARTLDICNEVVGRNLNIQFETPNGLSLRTLDVEVLDALVSAGLVRISLAIESGSDFIRNKIMRKHVRREKIYEVVGLTKKYEHLYVKAFFIIGMPEETKETLMDTYDMIKEIDVDRIYLQNIVPFSGTEVFEQALRDNLLVDVDAANIFKSGAMYNTNYNRIFIKPYKLDLEDLRQFRAKCDRLIAAQQVAKRRSRRHRAQKQPVTTEETLN